MITTCVGLGISAKYPPVQNAIYELLRESANS